MGQTGAWIPIEKDVYPAAWENRSGDLLYVEDTFRGTPQSRLSDFNDGRYAVKCRRKFSPTSVDLAEERFDDYDTAALYALEVQLDTESLLNRPY